jgi:LysR family hydrogen peroxide-inducible transcriptional activator
MELHQLRYVLAIAKTGNFSRAAEHCHVAQPSLSQQIQKLEGELGERLFDRLKRSAKLTVPGQKFLARATKILQEVEAAQREVRDASDLLCGTVTVGVLPTIAPYLLPPALVRFRRMFPGIEIIVQEDKTQRLLELALACEVDFAIVSRPILDERLEVRDLLSEELRLALPPGHPLNRKKFVSAADLQEEPLIVMKEGHCLGEQVLGFCESRHLHPKISFRSAQLETIQCLVQAGLGISLIPAMASLRQRQPRPEYRSLTNPRPHRNIVAVWMKQRPPGRAAAELLQVVIISAKPTSAAA